MQYIQCTQKLLKELKTKPVKSDCLDKQNSLLGPWHANLLMIEGRKCVLFTNNITLYSIFVPMLKKADFAKLPEIFRQELSINLSVEGIKQDVINKALAEYNDLIFTKTSSRSILGSMNEFAYQIEYYVMNEYPSIENIDLYEINRKINLTPMSSMEYSCGIVEIKKLLGCSDENTQLKTFPDKLK